MNSSGSYRWSMIRLRAGLVTTLAVVVVVVGCSDLPASPGLDAASLEAFTTKENTRFNPAPAPSVTRLQIQFDAVDLTGMATRLPWEGRFSGRDGSGIVIVTNLLLPAVQRGMTTQLSQQWTFITDGTSNTTVMQVDGLLNRQNGLLVLNGFLGAAPVHIRGETTESGGVTSIIAELMFNPQPDPPLWF
jgi:hypothetical protein